MATNTRDWRKHKVTDLTGLERRSFAASGMQLREQADGTLHLSGYASVTGVSYEVGWYQETIKRGAFRRTLGARPDVQLLINHTGMPLARTRSGTLALSEDDHGLHVQADLDPEDPDVQSLARKMRRGDIDQMSFAFQATDQTWNEDYTARTINAVSIHRGDVSVVNQGANSAAMAELRAAEQRVAATRSSTTIRRQRARLAALGVDGNSRARATTYLGTTQSLLSAAAGQRNATRTDEQRRRLEDLDNGRYR